ncbi:MAG TPA: GyrI-like domain-containing protein [Saprospiraceae bacterium]|nr:GyrI-like domain-containing protein [Saprospiraceae bacterium]HNT19706.1 GyrI-like domain-containing protein [Saprospiraceae bacterium]
METETIYQVQEVQWTEKTFVTKRDTVRFDRLSGFFTQAYGEIYTAIQNAGIRPMAEPFAIYYAIDEVRMETDLAAAVPVPEDFMIPAGFHPVTIPASKALYLSYYGGYENMTPAYAALEKHIAEHGYKKQWMLEQYFSDPEVEKDPAKWRTDIYFIVS